MENIENGGSNGSRGLDSSISIFSKEPLGTCFRLNPIMTKEKLMPCTRRPLVATMLDVGFPVPLPMSNTAAFGGSISNVRLIELWNPASCPNASPYRMPGSS